MKRLNKLNVGDLVKFFYIYNECALNNALAIYLGEDIIEREDGHKIVNHLVQIVGEQQRDTPARRGAFGSVPASAGHVTGFFQEWRKPI